MRPAVKIKGILGTAGMTYEELAKLCGLTRQTIHQYLNNPTFHMEDLANGIKVMDMANRLYKLCMDGKLPLEDVPKEERLEKIKDILG